MIAKPSPMTVFEKRSHARAAVLEAAACSFAATARRFPDVVAVYAFGSVGARRVGPHSDLDLLVVRETTLIGPQRGIDLTVAAELDVAVDLIVVTPLEYAERLPNTSFGRTILSSARRIDAT